MSKSILKSENCETTKKQQQKSQKKSEKNTISSLKNILRTIMDIICDYYAGKCYLFDENNATQIIKRLTRIRIEKPEKNDKNGISASDVPC